MAVSAPQPTTDSAASRRRAARVLIVEKEEHVARICLKALRHERFEREWATGPNAAWSIAEQWRPQLYIIGDDFPEALAIEFCGQLRGRTNAPILMVTASDAIGYQTNLLEAGADDLITRPILPPLLLSKVQALMRRAYRYSVPPVTAQPQPKKVAAPLQPQTPPDEMGTNNDKTDFATFDTWPRCQNCQYTGAADRFEGRDEQGRVLRACPVCGESNKIRYPNPKIK